MKGWENVSALHSILVNNAEHIRTCLSKMRSTEKRSRKPSLEEVVRSVCG